MFHDPPSFFLPVVSYHGKDAWLAMPAGTSWIFEDNLCIFKPSKIERWELNEEVLHLLRQ